MNSFELVNEKSNCCGCGLCAFKCPKNAIEMREDEYGYIYPFIQKDKCINCGICKKVCEYNQKIKDENIEKKAYVAVAKDDIILKSTASGGVFTSIAKSFIKNGGVVFGCALIKEDSQFIVKHIKITDIKDIEKLKGSKYVQSDITNIYTEIREEIKKGKQVLFSGTPCQVATIKRLTNNIENLYTIDIICHGVPNNKLFNDYINYTNKKKNIRIENFKFRDKKKGWGLYYYYYYYDLLKKEYNKKVLPAFKSSYYQLFLDSLLYRESCYNCHYANDKRVGDITIGDYWGIEIEHHELVANKKLDPQKGISCIIVNSTKGKHLLKENISNLMIFESEFDKIKKHNHQLNHPSKKHNDRELVLNYYKLNGYQEIDNYYKKKNTFKKIINNIWYNIPYRLRKIIKK